METNIILSSLIKNQRDNIPRDKKLSYNDLKRISKYLQFNIFNNDDCSLWNGYITIINHDENKSYINFYFNGKKHALHRLLYINFIGNLDDSEYIKFNCCNKGKCCNLNHFYKIKENIDDEIKLEIKKEDKHMDNIIIKFN
jgi:hypothetical protein